MILLECYSTFTSILFSGVAFEGEPPLVDDDRPPHPFHRHHFRGRLEHERYPRPPFEYSCGLSKRVAVGLRDRPDVPGEPRRTHLALGRPAGGQAVDQDAH